jgi:hypothetical protein
MGAATPKFPSNVNAMGSKPQDFGRDGATGEGRIGEPRPAGIVAEGRYGGSREMEGKTRPKGGRKLSRSR